MSVTQTFSLSGEESAIGITASAEQALTARSMSFYEYGTVEETG